MRPGLADLALVPRAVAELLVARLRLAKAEPHQVTSELMLTPEGDGAQACPLPPEIERVAYLIPRVAARLPWRADCLVQALAARRWLRKLGYRTELFIGARQDRAGFEAHAWLKWRGQVITGGEVEGYAPLERTG
jgi:hypothetical protein